MEPMKNGIMKNHLQKTLKRVQYKKMAEPVTITLVSKDQHCASSTISDQIVREVLSEVKNRHPEIEMKRVKLRADETCTIPGIQIHQFPSLLLNGKQITAGSIITEERLEQLIQNIIK